MTLEDYNYTSKSIAVNKSMDANTIDNNRDITNIGEEYEQSFTPPDDHYDFREGVNFDQGWPSQELVEFIHNSFVRFYEATAICGREIVRLSKQDILKLSPCKRKQTEKALQFLEEYDVIEWEKPSRKVYYNYRTESALNLELFRAIGALNSKEIIAEFLKERREEAREAHLQKVRSD